MVGFVDIITYGVAALAIGGWLLVGLYALWRAGRSADRLKSLRELAQFFDTMLRSDHRHPIWLWESGQVEMASDTRALLGFETPVGHIDELVGNGAVGLPFDVVERVKAALARHMPLKGALVAEYGRGRSRLVIEMQNLALVDERWPSSVLWVEETRNRALSSGYKGVRALSVRLEELTTAINALPCPIWIRNADFELVEVNAAYVRAVDAKDARNVIEAGRELFDRARSRGLLRAIETGQPTRERQFGVVEGSRRAFTVNHVPLGNEGHILGVALDVTGEEEALAELARVLESQSETLNRLRSPVAIFGPNQTLRFFNSAFTRLAQISEDVLSSDLRHGELLELLRERRRVPEQIDFRQWKEGILKYYTTLLEPFEEMWHLPDGTAHRVVTQPHPLGGLLILFEDVTDRLALERSYNTLVAVQRETLDNMRESVAVFGADGRLELSNPSFKALWQLPDIALEGNPHLTTLLPHLNITPGFDRDSANIRDGLPIWISERNPRTGRWYRGDGVVVDFSLVPLPDGGMMLSQNDVTDSFRIEQALRERSNALEAADRLKSEFITNMSYELRTPLNSIIGFSELLDQEYFGKLNPQQKDYIGNILQASAQLRDMISDVLDLAVIEAGEMDVEHLQVPVAEALSDAVIIARDLAHRANIHVVLDVKADPGEVEGDPRRLKQAFYNMISTLAGFTPHGGTLTVSAEDKDDKVLVTVVNPDCGLALDERETLVMTVAMGGAPRGRRATGLDLALVRRIVELHEGKVTLTAWGELGVRLMVELPRTLTAEADA
ncbi:PAS domain-containing sensor histidine kinase [Pseudokordiimonas caeni]|uniref:PAS domain-containing sensor histidine kinase n=1 Tax=Pseudokordiimonas caeni TaxID=2997908 RepID=UPI0028119F9E|nr:PAS-domain containing protein [Pseudokordiimonas caeni]